MNDKFSVKTQNEVNSILERLDGWKNLFFFEVKYFYEGWAIYMREKNTYPRSLVIFKFLKFISVKKRKLIKSFILMRRLTRSSNYNLKLKKLYTGKIF